MKKIYVLVVCLCVTIFLNAQTTWTGGGVTNNWSDGGNWTGGIAPTAGGDAVFSTNAVVRLDASVTLNSLKITSSSKVQVYTSNSADITLTSTSTVPYALQIDAGSRLEDSALAATIFNVNFANNAKGLIYGTWYFTGNAGGTPGRANFLQPATTALGNRIDINGSIIYHGTARPVPNTSSDIQYLSFNSGSTFWLDTDGGGVPKATWDANSTVKITGIVTTTPSFATGAAIGHLLIDAPGLAASADLQLANNLIIKGDFRITSTNGMTLSLASLVAGGTVQYTVNGGMYVTGNSNVIFVDAANDNIYILDVKGSFNMNSGNPSFSLRNSSGVTPINPTVLKVGGAFNQTVGAFGSNNPSTSTSTELFVVELDGIANQSVSSTGIIDNTNNQLVLRLNNTAGATLATPLSVGKISWNSTNKGILTTTSTNLLTIRNARDSVADPLVVNAPGTSGFVNGPVRRNVATIGGYNFPTGNATTYRPIVISPTVATASALDAQYFGSAYSDLSVQAPLSGVSNSEYWTVVLAPASPAINGTIQIALNGTPVNGATAAQSVVVAAYGGLGIGWQNAAGSQLSPGNTTTGSVISATRNTVGTYTFGYGVIGALAIHLLNFDAKKVSASAAAISWAITSNSTPSYFEVLKSADGSHFTKAAIVASTHFVYNYNFTDNNLSAGTTYYRLNMVDQNGSTTLSKIVAVVNSAKGVVMSSMLPTVVTGSARINVSSSQNLTLQLVVTDMNGRVIQRQLAGITAGSNQEVRLNLQSLAAGAYQVTGYAAGELIGTIRFIKQ